MIYSDISAHIAKGTGAFFASLVPIAIKMEAF